MRRFLVLLLAVGVGVVLGRMFDGMTSTAEAGGDQGAGGAVSGNGDVNGDGFINVSDGVYLLNWLFSGGPGPHPCESGGGDLPATGQTTCYDEDGNEIDCTSDTCAGQDGRYAIGCPSEGRFVDNGDGTVTDTCTGLMWQKDNGNSGDRLPWCSALAYCESLEFAGHDDWRLPNVRELQRIVDYGRFVPSIDPVFGTLKTFYWSSTSYAGLPGYAWRVSFDDGSVMIGSKVNVNVVRAVRSGP